LTNHNGDAKFNYQKKEESAMGLFKRLIVRLRSGRTDADLKQEWPFQSLSQLTLSELFDIYQWAWGSSPLEARAHAELCNRIGTLQEWIAIYKKALPWSRIENLALRRIRQIGATRKEWHQLFITSPAGSPLKKIAEAKMNLTSRS
jgi:hypothetical protein